MRDGRPLNVVIAGAGRAGLEAMFRLHRVAGPRAQVTVVAPNEEFSNRALDVLLPFATAHARRQNLRTLASAAAAEIAFFMPRGATWPVALYELALMTAERAFDQCQTCELTLLTGEPAPLAIFGAATAEALRDRLQSAGIALRPSVEVEVPARGHVAIGGGAERLIVDRVITVPVLDGPAVAGVGHDGSGFLVIDDHARVAAAEDVYAAGDVTSSPIKHGSMACRQADAAAEAIAAHAGVALAPAPISPVLEGVLLTERDALLMRREADAAGTPPEVLRRGSPGWPPAKITGRELALHLGIQPSAGGA